MHGQNHIKFDLGGVKTGLCLHVQQLTCKVKEKVKIKLHKYSISQHAMEAWDGMSVQLHAFLAWAHDGGESSSFTPRSLCHLRNSCCVPDEVCGLRSMSGHFRRQKNLPLIKIIHHIRTYLPKLIKLAQVPLSDIEDTRHRWEKQILKESICYFTREHMTLLFIFIV